MASKIRSIFQSINSKLKQFRRWQLTPAPVKPMSNHRHICLNCSHKYTGDFCPRCGQPASVKRLNAKTTTQGALDVWGMGSRSMPRAIFHLLFRPGYMIADYLHGHRQPYFPPFKMLFILTATAMLIAHVLPGTVSAIKGDSNAQVSSTDSVASVQADTTIRSGAIVSHEITKAAINPDSTSSSRTKDADEDLSAEEQAELNKVKGAVVNSVTGFSTFVDNIDKTNKPLSLLITQFFLTIGMYCFFRKSPRMGRLAFTEQFFGQVLMTSQLQVLSILYMLMTLQVRTDEDFALPGIIIVIVALIDFKQLYGFNWWKTIKKGALAMVVSFVFQVVFYLLGSGIYFVIKYAFQLES